MCSGRKPRRPPVQPKPAYPTDAPPDPIEVETTSVNQKRRRAGRSSLVIEMKTPEVGTGLGGL